jgi:hypothetical protein
MGLCKGSGGVEEAPAQEVLNMVEADNIKFLREKVAASVQAGL